MVVLAYLPVTGAGWVWDDSAYVWDNPALKSLAGLRQIWFEPAETPQYYPLTFSVFWLQHLLWGVNPAGYHCINVLLHALNTLLLWALLRRLVVPAPFFAAALFALHPVHVESVAWVTELKDVLSALFYLLAVLRWLRFAESRAWPHYTAALVLFTAAMLSKTATCTLPLILLLFTWWREPQRWRERLLQVIPFLIIGGALAWVTAWREPDDIRHTLSYLDRALLAGQALWFYAFKLLWPVNLMAVYPRWQINAGDPGQYLAVAAALAVVAVLWQARHRFGLAALVAVLYFALTLAPVLGFVNFTFMMLSYVADHFQYLASIGLTTLAAAAAARIANANVKALAGAIVLLALGALTWQRTYAFQDEEALWRDNLTKNPRAWVAQFGLGNVFQEQGRLAEAVAQFAIAARLEPTYANIHDNWGEALEAQEIWDEAIARYRAAVELDPTLVTARFHLGLALARQEKLEPAAEHLAAAVRLAPEMTALRVTLGAVLMRLGQAELAAQQFAAVLRLSPNDLDARKLLAAGLIQQGKLAEAVEHYEAVVRLAPDDEAARAMLEKARAAQP